MTAKRKPDIDELWEQILGLSPEQQRKLLQRITLCLPDDQEKEDSDSNWNEIFALNESISDEDLAKLPHDGSINYKHYLYGHPKEV